MILSVVTGFLAVPAFAVQKVTLAWNPVSDPSVVSYRIYWGTASHNYINVTNVGNKMTATIPGLVEGMTYFFAATSYTSQGLESPFSNETAYTVPRVPLRIKQVQRGGPFNSYLFTSATGTAPPRWTLEASIDLRNWHALATGTNPPVGVGVVAGPAPAISFRLRNPPLGVSLVTRTIQSNPLPNSYFITSTGPTLQQWVVEGSSDLKIWRTVASGTNSTVNVAVVPNAPPGLFFRLKGE